MQNAENHAAADIKVSAEVLAQAQIPIMRGYLLVMGVYYLVITASHPFFETGWALAILVGLSAVSTAWALAMWRRLARPASMLRLEIITLAMNALVLANVTAYLQLHFEPLKLVYFVIMALAFATSAPTQRVAAVSTVSALVGLVVMAREAPGDLISHYAFVGLAGIFGALGMSMLMRGAVRREIGARLAAEALNDALRAELSRNQALTREAQDLAVAARAADRAKGEFLATMSHEIRTPLNGVLGMVQVMARDGLPAPQDKRLEVVRQSADSLLDMLNTVLDISRIEAGKMTLHPRAFDLERFAQPLRALYGQLAEDKGLAFSLEIAPAAAGWRLADEVRLRQVLGNLVSNAIKFTETGSVRVRISGDADGLGFEIADTGPGIAAEHQARIFDRFVQGDGSHTRRASGTGLGLAVCKELVALMDGEIGFVSDRGRGTVFTVRTPAPRTQGPGHAPATPGLRMAVKRAG